MQYFGILYIKVDGVLQAKAQSIEVQDEDSGVPAVTLNGGLEGKTPSTHQTRGTIRSLVPLAGVEFDFHNSSVEDKFHEYEIIRGDGKRLSFTGWFMNPSHSVAVGEQMAYSAEFMGSPAKWV